MSPKIKEIILKEAEKAYKINEIPVGSVIVINGKIIAKAYNKKESMHDITAHAEILVIKKVAKKVKSWKLDNAILYSTLSPCAMCSEVIKHSRIKKVIYLVDNKKVINYKTTFHMEHHSKSEKLLKKYFKNMRENK